MKGGPYKPKYRNYADKVLVGIIADLRATEVDLYRIDLRTELLKKEVLYEELILHEKRMEEIRKKYS